MNNVDSANRRGEASVWEVHSDESWMTYLIYHAYTISKKSINADIDYVTVHTKKKNRDLDQEATESCIEKRELNIRGKT